MNSRKLASAYADAVLDCLESGIEQGIVYKDGMYLFANRDECESKPHLWVNRDWKKLVSGISAPADPADPGFSKLRLRAQIIESLLASGKAERFAAGILAIEAADRAP